VLKKQ